MYVVVITSSQHYVNAPGAAFQCITSFWYMHMLLQLCGCGVLLLITELQFQFPRATAAFQWQRSGKIKSSFRCVPKQILRWVEETWVVEIYP